MEELLKNFCKVLCRVRKESGRTQAEVADALGIDRSVYAYYEMGKVAPDLPALRKLLDLYGLPAEMFLYPERFNGQPEE